MYNRYRGNTGSVERVDDSVSGSAAPGPADAGRSSAGPARGQELRQNGSGAVQSRNRQQQRGGNNQRRGENAQRPVSAPGPVSKRPPSPLTGISGELGRLLSRLSPMNLETEDLILAMILYLMYRESHDEELLYIMAAMFLL